MSKSAVLKSLTGLPGDATVAIPAGKLREIGFTFEEQTQDNSDDSGNPAEKIPDARPVSVGVGALREFLRG